MKCEKKKILIIMPKFFGGGAERVLLNLFNQIDLTQYQIDLFLGLKGGRLENEIPQSVNVFYIFSHRIFEILTSVFLRYFNSKFLFYYFGKQIKINYDVGICYLDSNYSYFLNNTKGNLKRKVVVIHSSYKTYSYKFKKYKSESKTTKQDLYKSLDTILAVSKESMQEFVDIYGVFNDLRVIYNTLNVSRIKRMAMKTSQQIYEKEDFNILAIGSHIPVKNYKTLLQACLILKQENTNFKLYILGEGVLRSEHQKFINENDLCDVVKLQGFVENPYPYIKECDLFVMTSIAEGLPTALSEALVFGKATIATNSPGCREVIGNGKYGLMVENNEKEISNSIKKMIENPLIRKKYEELGLKSASRFSDKNSINEYEKIFNS